MTITILLISQFSVSLFFGCYVLDILVFYLKIVFFLIFPDLLNKIKKSYSFLFPCLLSYIFSTHYPILREYHFQSVRLRLRLKSCFASVHTHVLPRIVRTCVCECVCVCVLVCVCVCVCVCLFIICFSIDSYTMIDLRL